jgi:hypothetical protein
MEDLKGYLQRTYEKLEEKGLGHFWAMSDRADLKPFKVKSRKEVKALLQEKASYYRNKNIAEVSIYVNPKKLGTEDFVMSIKIVIYPIDEDGKLPIKANQMWGIRVNFYPDDFAEIKFSLKLVQALMRLVNDDTVSNDVLNGMSYMAFKKRLAKQNIDFVV